MSKKNENLLFALFAQDFSWSRELVIHIFEYKYYDKI